ncbi:hypothetical protein LOC67_17160 [Stieleria sp. JC731]|uniref:hypothetical protein n=1 Tax=Pirellulaceae TaxID=2691357 RepID=UPI001E417224|nr:hypothetical protein [Stieleria sp. JC731]MCC9602286.1 hypothetical protein [Stieleria sp. JC731]
MATDDEVRALAAKGWSDEIDALFENGLPDSQMKILQAAGLFDDDGEDDGLPPPLDDDVDEQVQDELERGNDLMEGSDFQSALEAFGNALERLPEPQTEYDYALHAYCGMGDAHFLLGNFAKCVSAFESAQKCDGGIGNPFVHLRLGQAYMQEGNSSQAADHLMRAYMAEGPEIFSDEDPIYLEFLKTKAKLD